MKVLAVLGLATLLCQPVLASPAGAETEGLKDLVARLFPATVNINVLNPGKDGGPAKRLYGSGFLVRPNGVIITNRHVVAGSYNVTVTLNDGHTYPARLLGANDTPDIAVLKIDGPTPFPTVEFGDSDKLERGETLIAIGNPLGLAGTVTVGVVSALNRNLGGSSIDNYIQTDTTINHGNSGGPLFNREGKVVGVNVAFVTPVDEGGSIGLGLSIPSNTVERLLDAALKYGKLEAGSPGFRVQALTPELAAAAGAPSTVGGIVTHVEPKGPGDVAGIRVGDVVYQVGDFATADARAMARELVRYTPGMTVKMKALREGKPFETAVKLEPFPAAIDPAGGPAMVAIGPRDTSPGLGFKLAALSDATRKHLDMPPGQSGVAIDGMVLNSPAGDLGLGKGDVILRISETAVAKPADVLAAFEADRKAGVKATPILVYNAGVLKWMPLVLTP